MPRLGVEQKTGALAYRGAQLTFGVRQLSHHQEEEGAMPKKKRKHQAWHRINDDDWQMKRGKKYSYEYMRSRMSHL
jgi:hypothetical protein